MIPRSRELWMVAFFLSKYAQKTGANTSYPPEELEANKWKTAYRMFYDSLGDGRTIDSFEHSLKNTRDAYDSHLDSNRVGWLNEDGNPNTLNHDAASVLKTFSKLNRNGAWDKIKGFADTGVSASGKVIDDLAAIQNMELDEDRISHTEGGTRIVISVKYERSIKVRKLAFKFHGDSCAVCKFNFADTYGEWGKGFGEVHHLVPVSEGNGLKKTINAKTDLIVLCANCHRMVHRKKGITLTVEELTSKLSKK
ncbi:MAG: hypothetical protein JWQ25_1891 [Daejeonella sp.]|nr:hypothetical protein [Daejeonella sp.]